MAFGSAAKVSTFLDLGGSTTESGGIAAKIGQNAIIDEAAVAAGRDPRVVRRMLNVFGDPAKTPAQWVDELVPLVREDGVGTIVLGSDDPLELQRFAAEVMPAVREEVARGGRPPASRPGRCSAPPLATCLRMRPHIRTVRQTSRWWHSAHQGRDWTPRGRTCPLISPDCTCRSRPISRPERVSEAWPPATLARLRALKKQYDPTNVFRDNFNIDPLGD